MSAAGLGGKFAYHQEHEQHTLSATSVLLKTVDHRLDPWGSSSILMRS